MVYSTSANFDAENFVNDLITIGSELACDNTNNKYNEYELPQDFDEAKFKRGQKFYNDNIFMLFIGKLVGLVTILAVPSMLKLLMFTNMSSTPFTAYKRYMATIFHMNVWYTDDFKPGSSLWKSMEDVRKKHNSASQRSVCSGANRISQLDMALTQFGFMGFALTHPAKIGLFNPDPVSLEGWVYLWRTIGNLMGIEDRFNICRPSVEETRQICRLLIEKQFKIFVERADVNFLKMATALMDGMWVMQPVLMPELAFIKTLRLVSPDSQTFKDEYARLTPKQKARYDFEERVISMCRNSFIRWFNNMTMHMSLWLMRNFPFLAIWRFGRKNAYVRILDQSAPSVRNLYQSG